MKKISLLIAVIAMIFVGCGPKRSQAYYDAPSKVLSANYDGSYVIRVQVRARNAAIAFTDGQRKAVQEVIFDGVKAGSNGISDLKPLCFDLNAREKYEDYWNAFFQDNGEWTNYASLKDKRTTTTRYQRDGRQMIETVTVTVMRAELKKKLQEDGIIPKAGRFD
jgi:hypothetical protein